MHGRQSLTITRCATAVDDASQEVTPPSGRLGERVIDAEVRLPFADIRYWRGGRTPAPPNPSDGMVIQIYIHALETKDAAVLVSTLARDVEVRLGAGVIASSRADWAKMVAEDFAAANLAVRVEGAWYGISTSDRENAPTALLLEREDRVFGDCCVFHRSEVLTIRDHHIARIDRSPALANQRRGTP